MNEQKGPVTFAEFRVAVREAVLRRLGPEAATVRATADGAVFERGALTVRVSVQHGAVVMTYVAQPTAAFGHSSGYGLPQQLTRQNVEIIANEVATRLADAFLHRSE
jgi:hypothetical protein